MKLSFSEKERKDLLKAWLAVSVAFTIAFFGVGGLTGSPSGVLVTFVLMALAAGLGFLLHELAHKFVAQHFNAKAEFRSDDKMLLMMLIVSLFGIIFAAPGAVVIRGRITRRQSGLSALAGPLTNIVLAVAFFGMTFLEPAGGIIHSLGRFGAWINAFLAVFNMIPFGPFDGKKVFVWNNWVWGVTSAAAVFLLILVL